MTKCKIYKTASHHIKCVRVFVSVPAVVLNATKFPQQARALISTHTHIIPGAMGYG